MKTFKFLLATVLVSLCAMSCSPDTADIQENNNENVSEVDGFSPAYLSRYNIRRR